MRFLISVTLLGKPPSLGIRQRLDAMLERLEAMQLAPTLWLTRTEGNDPGDAGGIANLLLNIVGEGDYVQVIVAPMPYDAAGFGVSNEVGNAIGAAGAPDEEL